MLIKRMTDLLVAHTVPLEEIHIDLTSITVELDDINGKRRTVFFRPFQAVRVTTIDCVDLEVYGGYRGYLLECIDSPWIEDLQAQLVDSEDNFLEKSKHFIMDLGDNLLEIVAWSVNIL